MDSTRPGRMSPRDWALSMRISRRARNEGERPDLRSLLVHRLRPTNKAVLREPLRGRPRLGVHCEPCQKWSELDDDDPVDEVVCPHCGQLYVIEFAVYRPITDDDD